MPGAGNRVACIKQASPYPCNAFTAARGSCWKMRNSARAGPVGRVRLDSAARHPKQRSKLLLGHGGSLTNGVHIRVRDARYLQAGNVVSADVGNHFLYPVHEGGEVLFIHCEAPLQSKDEVIGGNIQEAGNQVGFRPRKDFRMPSRFCLVSF